MSDPSEIIGRLQRRMFETEKVLIGTGNQMSQLLQRILGIEKRLGDLEKKVAKLESNSAC